MSGAFCRPSGIALALAGVLQALGSALHPNDVAATPYFQSPLWAPAHLGLALSFLLCIFGFVGMYARQWDRAGILGAAGFVGAVAGSALLVGVTVAEASLLPSIAAGQPLRPLADWLDPRGPLALAVLVSLVALAAYTVGFVLFGIATARASVFPRWAGRLLAVGTLLSNGEFFGPIGFATYVVGGVILGLALTWLGIALLRRSG